MNVLGRSDGPLFFPIQTAPATALTPPAMRRGEAIRTHVRSLSAMQKEALVVSHRTGAAWRLASDEGAYLNGADEAPCPLSFLTTGMVASFMEEITVLARARDIGIRQLRLVLDNYYTMRGSALQGTMTGGAKDIELDVQIDSPAGRDQLTQLLHDAIAASPVSGLARHRHESLFALQHNGVALEATGVRSFAGPFLQPAADAAFDSMRPANGDWAGLITRGGPSPKTDEVTSSAGSSLAEHQDRTLHVRGICVRRPDGVKQIEQQLLNPHGSIFHYLCDEAPANGGSGLAPDALSYFAAGIAFCFMTQLGRYAMIARKDLRDYRIVQDTHLSPGHADPVETHVALSSGEDDAFAQTALAMAEQTCFLHALCRAEVKTRIRLTPCSEAA